MSRARILFADNTISFVKARKEFLEKEGFEVIVATNPSEARKILERERIDVAILDIRLLRDEDENDVSGLTIAMNVARSVPKIMLTGHATVEAAIQALAPNLEGLPPAVKFLTKQHQKQGGPEALIAAVKEALQLGKRAFQQTADNISRQLNEDYTDARKEARVHYWSSIVVALLGIGLIFGGIVLTLQSRDEFPVGVASSIGGIVTEVVNYLFFRRVDVAHKRVDVYHNELLQMRLFESLISVCDELQSIQDRERAKNEIIEIAAKQWLAITRSSEGDTESNPS